MLPNYPSEDLKVSLLQLRRKLAVADEAIAALRRYRNLSPRLQARSPVTCIRRTANRPMVRL